MKKLLSFSRLAIILSGFIWLTSFTGSVERNINKIEKEWVSLFNGKDLTGWKIHGTELWFVKDGKLICESGPDKKYGYLATEKKFKNFELKLEFLQEANGNSGVFFRSSLDGTKISGWQVEVAPPGHDTGGIYESYGRGWLVKIPDEKENILKMGEWNQLKVRVVGDHVKTWLNGVQMVDFNDEKIGEAGEGVIALQIHSGGGIKVSWKNILIKEL
jgi:putative component of toxin-antitoxin plasmid stabilization module